MNKKTLIRTVSQELDPPVSQTKIALIVDKAVEVTKRTLTSGEPVRWSGFGTLTVKNIPPRRFYSARLGRIYPLERHKANHFRAAPNPIVGRLYAVYLCSHRARHIRQSRRNAQPRRRSTKGIHFKSPQTDKSVVHHST